MLTGVRLRPLGTADPPRARNGRGRGFTLIELMIALAVASLVFFVALPGYRYAKLKSGRIAGKGYLLDVMARQEQFFANNKRYAQDLRDLGLPSILHVDSQARRSSSRQAAYHIELLFEEGMFAGARAIPRNTQRQDHQCMTFSISLIGVRSVSGASSGNPEDCW